MAYDDVQDQYIILNGFEIMDSPEFRHRGVLLDSSRNFMPMETIRNVVDGMSFNKVRLIY